MRTNKRTTYILLERGDEDQRLKIELDRVFAALGIMSQIELVKKYPLMVQLRQALADEIRDEESDD